MLKKHSRIVVAMSGGVDSSTVAAMLHNDGHEVIGITLQLYDHGVALKKKGACCAGQDIHDAKTVASKLGIKHYVLDYETNFKQSVIDDFVNSYMHGETPLPCVRCNQYVKFQDLMEVAKSIGANILATGHYVRKCYDHSGIASLHTGIDATKDQSYFLFTTTKEQLDFLHFPLGGMTKDQTRELAIEYGLFIADKPDSQDICFVPNGNYRAVINEINPNANKKGKILHIDGFELGQHNGVINYTIGQRRGIGIAFNSPLYVVKIDPDNNIIYVGSKSDLESKEFVIKDVNWLGNEITKPTKLKVKIRSTKPPSDAIVQFTHDGKMVVQLLQHEEAVTPGQACVIYDHDKVLGGGWIMRQEEYVSSK